MVIVIMGVSGSGKTTIGKKISKSLGWKFYEGDDYHPQKNVEKMSNGIPLNDEDRKPWLQNLSRIIAEMINEKENAVITCSALKKIYRNIIKINDEVKFVYLKSSYDLIKKRMKQRNNHFMKADMLASQFEALEEPEDAISVSIDKSEEQILKEIYKQLKLNIN